MSDVARTPRPYAAGSSVASVVAALVGNYEGLLAFAERYAGSRALAESLLLRAFVVALYDADTSGSPQADASSPDGALVSQLCQLLSEALIVQRAPGAATVTGKLHSSTSVRQRGLSRRLRPRGPARSVSRRGRGGAGSPT